MIVEVSKILFSICALPNQQDEWDFDAESAALNLPLDVTPRIRLSQLQAINL